MVFPNQRPTNFDPYQMQRMPNNRMFPNRGLNGPPRGNNIQNMIQRFLPSQGMQQATLPTRAVGGLSGTLNNVQQVLKIVQSTAPIVQQYGPMMKNLPMMYRMMKALKDVDDDDTNDDVESTAIESTNKNVKPLSADEKADKVKKSTQGLSKPKLYI